MNFEEGRLSREVSMGGKMELEGYPVDMRQQDST